MFGGFLGSIYLFVLILVIIIPIIMLIETFKMFNNIKDIKDLLIEQNEKSEALLKLGIMIKNSKKDLN